MRQRRLEEEVVALRGALKDRYQLDNIVGSSPAMQEVFSLIDRIAVATDASPNLTGAGDRVITDAVDSSYTNQPTPSARTRPRIDRGLPGGRVILTFARRTKLAFLVTSLVLAGLPTTSAEVLSLGDDDTVEIVFTAGFRFPLFGTFHDSVFVNSNGNLTFGRGDILSIPDAGAFLSGPARIAALWADLDPTTGGIISTVETAASFAVTFDAVSLFGELTGNTFTMSLSDDGSFALAYGDVSATAGISGYSAGLLVTVGDEIPVDLTAEPRPVGNGSLAAVYEDFTPAAPVDLAGLTLPFVATWDYFRFYASDTAFAGLLRLNGWTGLGTVVGSTARPNVQGLSFAPAGTLYGVDTSNFPLSAELITIDPADGASTLVGPLGYPVVNSLAFAADGTLYGVEMDPGVEKTTLLTIDPGTGAASFRAAMSSADISALTASVDGYLYAIDDDTDRLIRVDPATGAETPVGSLGYDRVLGLVELPDGRLFATREELIVGEGFQSFLLEIDRATGRAWEVGGTKPAAIGGLAHRCTVTNGGVEICDGLDNDCDGVIGDDLDLDGDGLTPCAGDCDDTSRDDMRLPEEVQDLRLYGTWLDWQDLGPTTGAATRYDVAVANQKDFSDGRCLYGDLSRAAIDDPTPAPPAPSVLYILVRAQNGCGDGPYLTDWTGTPLPDPVPDCF